MDQDQAQETSGGEARKSDQKTESSVISEAVRERFVGRVGALKAFYLRFSDRHMKNGVYYCGRGGLGKTWILQRIRLDNAGDPAQVDNAGDPAQADNAGDPARVVPPIIDCFGTQNHSIRGLQATIRDRLDVADAFQAYDEALSRLDAARSRDDETSPSAIAGLQAWANRCFIDCCQQAVQGREVVLLFDTFERVQEQDAGRWLLRQFLPNVRDVIFAIAGRPDPGPASMPDSVVPYELEGLSLNETVDYVERRASRLSKETVETLWRHTGGAPLIIDLILDMSERKRVRFIADMANLKEDEVVQENDTMQRALVDQFARVNRFNYAIWAMAYLRRRFDLPMLRYVVEHGIWFELGDYDKLYKDLKRSIYVKEHPEHQVHLLHDEIQRMVAQFVLGLAADTDREMGKPLLELISDRYYPQAIDEAEPDLARQLRAERLGYILDKDASAGLEQYRAHVAEIESTLDYDFEELLWNEIRIHRGRLGEDEYEVFNDRGEWLGRKSLFQKAEDHYRQMLDWFPDQRIDVNRYRGFMALRQGKVDEAERVFRESLTWVKEDDHAVVAALENLLGQTAEAGGEWNRALAHYARSFRAATLGHDNRRLASVYINRGYLYALKGQYEQAKHQCRLALDLLETEPEGKNKARGTVYAWMNLGTAHRHSDDYEDAESYYQKALELARENGDSEGVCDTLQHLGINAHLWGRKLRRKGVDLATACERQAQAWTWLTEALEVARRADWRAAIARGLHRLAKIYREIHRLEDLSSQLRSPSFEADLHVLERTANPFMVPGELEYEHDLLLCGPFAGLNQLERATRLFEVSALMADDAGDYHRALDGLVELARAFLELGRFDLVHPVLRRLERLKGFDYEEELFAEVSETIKGDLHFELGQYDEALAVYENSYAALAKLSGFASYQLNNGLRNLRWRFTVLPFDRIVDWCDGLEMAWLARSVSIVRPDMLDLLERVRLAAVQGTRIPLDD